MTIYGDSGDPFDLSKLPTPGPTDGDEFDDELTEAMGPLAATPIPDDARISEMSKIVLETYDKVSALEQWLMNLPNKSSDKDAISTYGLKLQGYSDKQIRESIRLSSPGQWEKHPLLYHALLLELRSRDYMVSEKWLKFEEFITRYSVSSSVEDRNAVARYAAELSGKLVIELVDIVRKSSEQEWERNNPYFLAIWTAIEEKLNPAGK